jgi:hypothetical protein
MDLATLENLKARNRTEKIFKAKCCDAHVQIRTPEGKIPHFYHLNTIPGCQGSKGETQEHLGLKSKIALAAIAAGWAVECEAEMRRSDGTLIWKADVLAQRGNSKVAFEVERSKPDWTTMMERQERYWNNGRVRGLWFVKTKKPFPSDQRLPVFSVSEGQEDWLVNLRHPNDWPNKWSEKWGTVPLSEFIGHALKGELKWAHLAGLSTASCQASVHILGWGRCHSCQQFIGHPYALTMGLGGMQEQPSFDWHRGMTHRRTFWVDQILSLLQSRLADNQVGFIDRSKNTCMACGAKVQLLEREEGTVLTKSSLLLSELPKPRLGTIEWDWINRWTLLRSPSQPL